MDSLNAASRSLVLALLSTSILLLAGCFGSQPDQQRPAQPPALPSGPAEPPAPKAAPPTEILAGTSWVATTILDRPAGSARSTLEIGTDNTVGGNAGCNNYRGSAELEDELITFGPLAVTRMMCPPAIGGQETVFLDTLENAAAWDRQGETLHLLDKEGTVIAKFQLLP